MTVCKYCGKPENYQFNPGLVCKVCTLFVHLECLSEKKTPGNLSGDVFFTYTCIQCSENKVELFERNKLSWLFCLVLILHDLSKKCNGISNQGFYHWRTHIASFINRHWNDLFHRHVKKKKNWSGTLAGSLSHFSHLFFQSGSSVLQEHGWWKLKHSFSPALINYLNSEILIQRQRERAQKTFTNSISERAFDCNAMESLLVKIGLRSLIKDESESQVFENDHLDQPIPLKKPKLYHKANLKSPSCTPNFMSRNESDSISFDDEFSHYFVDGEESLSDFDSLLPEFDELSENSNGILFQSETSNTQFDYHSNYQSSEDNGDNDSVGQNYVSKHNNKLNAYSEGSNDSNTEMDFVESNQTNKILKSSKITNHYDSNVQELLFEKNNFEPLPWDSVKYTPDIVKQEPTVIASEFDEVQMLSYLNGVFNKGHLTNVDKRLVRLRAKLSLRKLKRSKHIPLWNLDSFVCKLSNYPIQDDIFQHSLDVRVLDRFQHVAENLSGSTVSSQIDFATRLTGHSEELPFLSSYSGRLLKPYIRRDTETTPMWLKLMDELTNKVNSKNPGYSKLNRAPLDYCYVRPHHIASINSLCSLFFWPGIDLTEALQYPDFSCVVLYKKLVIGFAFLVPDVGTNEAYLSYIFTRPDWRRSGIANFMLYHLIQTCIGKDITLHVSATNPAVFLYQKFGFKIEQLVQEFYNKYFSADSTECKHALFLRLCR